MRASDLPSVELESMNRDHRDQVEAINAVLDALDRHDGTEASLRAIDEAVEAFEEHTREHFRQEDDQMHRYEFAAFEMHKEEHARALERARRRIGHWRAERDLEDLARYFRDEFPAWLVNHVTLLDAVSAQYVSGKAH